MSRNPHVNRLVHVCAFAACLLLFGMGMPVRAQEQPEPTPQSRDPESHDMEFRAGFGCTATVVQTKAGTLTTSSGSYTNLTSASITIPTGQSGYVLATLSGESRCTGTVGAWCTVRMFLVHPFWGPFEMHPEVGNNFAFDSVAGSDDRWESHSMQRISDEILSNQGMETMQVDVEWAVYGNATFALDDWLFKIEFCRKK
jgi:hypothetical protein